MSYKDMYAVIHVIVYSRYNDAYFVRCSTYGAVGKVTKERASEATSPTCIMCAALNAQQ